LTETFFVVLLANKRRKCNAGTGEITIRTKRTHCGSGDANSQQFELSYKLSVKINNNSGTVRILVVFSNPSLALKGAKGYSLKALTILFIDFALFF